MDAIFAEWLKQAKLPKDIDHNTVEHRAIGDEEKTKRLQKFGLSYWGKRYFEDDGSQNYLLFLSIYRYFKKIGNICIVYKINLWSNIQGADFVLRVSKLTKNVNPDQYEYYGYGIITW